MTKELRTDLRLVGVTDPIPGEEETSDRTRDQTLPVTTRLGVLDLNVSTGNDTDGDYKESPQRKEGVGSGPGPGTVNELFTQNLFNIGPL